MRVLHLAKTSHGARWASAQAGVLGRRNVEVHVALPDLDGPVAREWMANGTRAHRLDYTFSVRRPWTVKASAQQLRRLVDVIQPDLVHAHHVAGSLLARLALRRYRSLLRIFQVPGPLHLENLFFRTMELSLATPQDYWIASSRAILAHYLRAGIDPARVFLSYSGTNNERFEQRRTGWLRERLGLTARDFIVGNISYIYSPRWYLWQRTGLKCHEDLIEGISLAAEKDSSIRGVLIGGPWGSDATYFEQVRRYARERSAGAVLMPGPMNQEEVARAVPDFDCAAHVPLSENCGGVVEPLLCGLPTIASRVGGLVEVIMDGLIGITVPVHDPHALASAILHVRDNYGVVRKQAETGRALVETMFDVNRTGLEVYEIYRYLLGQRETRPEEFDSRQFVKTALAVAAEL